MSLFRLNAYSHSIMNMQADIYIQQNAQSESGVVTRQWLYDKTIFCKVAPIANKSGRGGPDDKNFDRGADGYTESLFLKMQSPIRFSKRWRIANIMDSNGNSLFVEPERYSLPDTYFDVISSHPVMDPFGKVAYYEINLRRTQVQKNDTAKV